MSDSNGVILSYASLSPGADARATGRLLTYTMLRELTGVNYSDSDLSFGSRGRPFIAGAPSFSITHSAHIVAAAVATSGAVGIDVELTDRVMVRGLRKVCDAEELQLAERHGASWVWVAKEAAIKCLGLSALMAGQVRLLDRFALLRGQVLHIARPVLAAQLQLAIATETPLADNAIRIRQLASA